MADPNRGQPRGRAEHPKLPAALLLVGVTLLILLLSVWSTLAPS
jgi:hypothetical protein